MWIRNRNKSDYHMNLLFLWMLVTEIEIERERTTEGILGFYVLSFRQDILSICVFNLFDVSSSNTIWNVPIDVFIGIVWNYFDNLWPFLLALWTICYSHFDISGKMDSPGSSRSRRKLSLESPRRRLSPHPGGTHPLQR